MPQRLVMFSEHNEMQEDVCFANMNLIKSVLPQGMMNASQ
jgi:hypothetical protein